MNRFSIAARMTGVFAVIAVILASLTAAGLYDLHLSDRDIAEVYEARLVPVSDLTKINDLMHRSIDQLTIGIISHSAAPNMRRYTVRVEEALAEIARLSARYSQDNGDNSLLAGWNAKREDLIAKAIKPTLAALQKQDFNEAEDTMLGAVKKLAAAEEAFDAFIAAELARAQSTREQASARYRFTERMMLGAAAFTLMLCGLVAYRVRRTVTGPLAGISRALKRLANGDKTVEVPYTQRSDEVGETAKAAQSYKESLLRIEAMEATQKAAEQVAESERKAAMLKVANLFETAMGEIAGSIFSASGELEVSASKLLQASEASRKLSDKAAAASGEASGNVQSVAAAATQLSMSAAEINRQVQESHEIASEAVAQAGKTDARIAELAQAANRIGDVVGLIKTVAGRTNLLALNASIEAERSGKAGRGFAVVAAEVKLLATQTAKATEDIRRQIAAVQSATQESVAAIKVIGSTIGRMSDIAGAIAGALAEQESATGDIARNVNRVAERHLTGRRQYGRCKPRRLRNRSRLG